MYGRLRIVRLRQRKAALIRNCWGLPRGNLTLFCLCPNGWADSHSIPFGSSRENSRRKASDLECSYSKVLSCYTCKHLCATAMAGVKTESKRYEQDARDVYTISTLEELKIQSVAFIDSGCFTWGFLKQTMGINENSCTHTVELDQHIVKSC